jgi:ABC-2 type transport system permease protein
VNWPAVRLVAEREIRERGRARSFRVTLILGIVIAAAAVIIPKALSGSSGPLRIGVVPATPLPVASLEKAVNRQIIVISPVSADAARAELRAKTLDVAVIDGTVETRVAPLATDNSATSRLAFATSAILTLEHSYQAAGLTPAQVSALANAPPVHVAGLQPSPHDRTHRQVTTLIGVVLLFGSIQAFGSWILTGVAAEKTSRVVEILLATLRTEELLTGKIVGIGVLALAQVVAVAAAAFAAALLSGSHVLSGASGWTVLEMGGWFLLGYAYYSCLFAAGGSLVSRQEEAANAQFPIILPLLIAYVTSFTAINNPTPFVVALSYLPPTSPIAMPMRIAAGNVPAWQVVLAVGLLLVATVFAVRIASRVYDRAILRTGGRLSWRQALTSGA